MASVGARLMCGRRVRLGILLFNEGKYLVRPAYSLLFGAVGFSAREVKVELGPGAGAAERKMLVRVVEILDCETNVLEIVLALRAPGCFASGLNRRQEKGNENADDRNYDQQLDERKTTPLLCWVRRHGRAPLFKLRQPKGIRLAVFYPYI